MKLYFDLHTHTVESGHAYSTLKENMEVASKLGLFAYGISEHSYTMEGSPNPIHFRNYRVIPDTYLGVKFFSGSELNILDFDGNVDADDFMLENLDYLIASLHTNIIAPGNQEENMRAIVKVFENPKIKILGHPDDSRYELDYDMLAKKAKEFDTVLEVNNSSLSPGSFRQGAHDNVRKMLTACMKYGSKVIVNSDAHFCDSVGSFDYALKIIEEVGFPDELIVNSSIEGLRDVINNTDKLNKIL